MMPKSFSATALQVASLCLGRYAAESYKKGDRLQNTAANLGTSVHDALENYVKMVYLEKTHERGLKLLIDLFDMGYLRVFGNLDKGAVDYKDGKVMLEMWFKRGDLDDPNRQVISCEVKTNFPVRVAGYPETPFNYIWDRFDKTGEHEYTVVDYKSNRWSLTHDELRKKPQAKAYGLAAQIQYPDAERIWVEFDFLRHEGGAVGTVFTREDNKETWRQFKKEFQRIWDTDEDAAPLTLNNECGFCVRKATCPALTSNLSVLGVYSVGTPEEMADRRANLEFQRAGISRAIEELDTILMGHMRENDIMEIDTEDNKLIAAVSGRRSVDGERAKQVLGPDLWNKYGSSKMSVGDAENLLKGGELDAEQKKRLRALITKTYGEPKMKVEHKTGLTGP